MSSCFEMKLLILKHLKLNHTVEVGSELTTLFIFLNFYSQHQRTKAGSMALRSRNFHAMYLAAGSSVFAQSEIIEVFNQRTTM